MVTNNGYCQVNGKTPADCKNSPISTLTDCEAACTAHEPCVGYEYQESKSLCYLIPSSRSCPTGYTLNNRSITAATSNELEAYEYPGMVCYGKNIGNIIMLSLYNLTI